MVISDDWASTRSEANREAITGLLTMPKRTEIPSIVLLRSEDNVAVSCRDMEPGEMVMGRDTEIAVTDPVPLGHKISVELIVNLPAKVFNFL